MKLEFSGQIFEKVPQSIKFHEKPSSGSGVVPRGKTDRQTDGQTDMMQLIAAFEILRTRLKRRNVNRNLRFEQLLPHSHIQSRSQFSP